MTTQTIPISNLVEDFDVYPRHAVDGSHVAELERVIRAGFTLPPIVAEADGETHRVVDGIHRLRAWRRVLGDNGEIGVELRSYADEAALFQDAVSMNSTHGRKLDQLDRTRSVLLLEKMGVSVKTIAITLHTTEERVEQLTRRIILVQQSDGTIQREPARPILYNTPTRVLTEEQALVHASAGGHNTAQTLGQLIRELELEVWPVEPHATQLWRLHDLIEAKVPKPTLAS